MSPPAASAAVDVDWPALTREFGAVAGDALAEFIGSDAAHFDSQLAFALGRVEEGRRVCEFLQARLGFPLRILDVGAGNGGVAIAAAHLGHEVHGLDVVPNRVFRLSRIRMASEPGESRLRCSQTVGSGAAIPYAAESFDAVLCLETLEHVEDAAGTGREIMRVLRPGGMCMVTTPARAKYLFARDPHYGVPGLLLLPDHAQRLVATKILRRVAPDRYDVVHVFWTLRGIAKRFPGSAAIEPLFNRPRPESRGWRTLRNLLWDRLVITKVGWRSPMATERPSN